MAASGLLLIKGIDPDHHVFNLEAAEITLFAVFWIVQTAELWDRGLRTVQWPLVKLAYDHAATSLVAGLSVPHGGPDPTGTVTFDVTQVSDVNATTSTTKSLVGHKAKMPVQDFQPDSYVVSARYSGDTNWLPSNSNSVIATFGSAE
jgi:hypothetical protein